MESLSHSGHLSGTGLQSASGKQGSSFSQPASDSGPVHEHPSILFVGAGPVGLYAAIQTKLHRPGKNLAIRMLEKYENPQRDNLLKLKPKRFAEGKQDPFGVIAGLKAELDKHPFMRIQDLENTLRSLAKRLGIEIVVLPEDGNGNPQGVEDMQKEIIDAYPYTKLIVGSDGARSRFRTHLFPKENLHRQPLRYAAHIKYEIEGNADGMDTKTELYPLLKKNNFPLGRENIGKPQDGKTPVSLQVVIDRPTYESLEKIATAKNPIHLFAEKQDEIPVPQELIDDVKRFIGVQVVNHGSRFDPATVRLSVTETPQHYCDSVLEFKEGQYRALLGDAAMGLSFYKGVNAGLKAATKFGKVVANNWEKLGTSHTKALDRNFLENSKRSVEGSVSVDPVRSGDEACVVVNKIVHSRVRLFERNPLDPNMPLVTAFDTAFGTSREKAEARRKEIVSSYPFHEYQTWFSDYSAKKIRQGNDTNHKIERKKDLIVASSKVPWQVIKYSTKQVNDFKDAVDDIIENKQTAKIDYIKKSSFRFHKE